MRMSLRFEQARGQCFGGASVMKGHKNGVVTINKSKNPKCLYTHCYGHTLNLAINDTVKNIQILSDTFDTIREICKLITDPPKRDTHLKVSRELSENDFPSVHRFSPTRWTVEGKRVSL